MKIGIIGSGSVGKAIARAMINLDYEVMIGTRDVLKKDLQDLKKENIKLGTFEETSRFGEVMFIATKWDGTKNAIELANPKNFDKKIVVDITNPLKTINGKVELEIGFNNSAGEEVQKLLKNSKVVKAFNIITSSYMGNGNQFGTTLDMFIAGNDSSAKKWVSELLKKLNWNPIDLGDIKQSRLLEPLAMIWITYGGINNTWTHAFKLLK